jgi:hypothetical protein
MTGSAPGRRAVVLREYVAQYPDPITVVAGAVVRVEKDDPEFPGWWWCVAEDGRAGWVHSELLTPSPAPGSSARLRVDYTARELTVQRAMRLTVLDERGGWLYVSAPDGATGWVPASHVGRDDSAP